MKHSRMFTRVLRNGEKGPILGISLGINFSENYIEYEGDRVDAQGLRLYEFSDTVYLIYWPGHFIPDIFEPNPRDLEEWELSLKTGAKSRVRDPEREFSTPGLACAWSPWGFIISVQQDQPEIVTFLKELYQAFCIGKGYTCVMKQPPFTDKFTLCVYVQIIEGESIQWGGELSNH